MNLVWRRRARLPLSSHVEIVLERADLVGRPFLGQGGEGVRRGAGAVIVEGRGVAPQRDVDGERNLLDRAHAVEPMGAEVARQIEEFDGGEVGGRDALEDLLVGRIGRLGRTPVLADQRLDRRAVDDVERVKRADYGFLDSCLRRRSSAKCRPRSYLTAPTQITAMTSHSKNKR
jgi:hypothetical protein